MIVEPDFPDHWKVQLLVSRLESEGAVRCLLRLWANCQQRRTDEFRFSPETLAAVCRWSGLPSRLWEAMTDPESGWLEEMGSGEGSTVNGQRSTGSVEHSGVPRGTMWRVRGFREVNATLFGNWTRNTTGKKKNGGSGGSGTNPVQDPTGTPRGSPTATPPAPHGVAQSVSGVPAGVPDRRDRREGIDRIEGKGVDGMERTGTPPTLEAALAWAEKFSQGNTRGMVIPAELVREWHDDRQVANWDRPMGQHLVPIADWQADLRDFTKWKAEGRHPSGGGMPQKNGGRHEVSMVAPDVEDVAPERWTDACDCLYDFDWLLVWGKVWQNVPAANRREIRNWLVAHPPVVVVDVPVPLPVKAAEKERGGA